MNRIFILLMYSMFFISCDSSTSSAVVKTHTIQSEHTTLKFGKKFFEYDELIHYSINISDEKVLELEALENKSDDLKLDLLEEEFPTNISDTSFIEKLEKFGYIKKVINKEKFASIDSIFVEKNAIDKSETNCLTIYRNILIFKARQKTVGIAKVCFNCGKKFIVGTKAETNNFGYDDDFKKLLDILNN